MRISRLYIDQPLQPDSQLTLCGQQAHYLSKVLRLKVDAPVIIFNGQGGEYKARITRLNKHELELSVDEYIAVETESPLRTILGLGLSRGERMDLAIQKSTELGVSCIVPLFTDYCEVKLKAERLGKKLRHWQQIIISACEQSGRTGIPEIQTPQNLSTWCEKLETPLKLIFEPSASSQLSEQKAPEELALLVGPEGGFSPTELTLTEQQGFVPVRLGPRILRTETAPVAALSALQLYWGDFKF